MNRFLAYALVILTGIAGNLYLENREVRGDQHAMKYSYGTFLSAKVKGEPISTRIQMGRLAVFKSDQGMVACTLLK